MTKIFLTFVVANFFSFSSLAADTVVRPENFAFLNLQNFPKDLSDQNKIKVYCTSRWNAPAVFYVNEVIANIGSSGNGAAAFKFYSANGDQLIRRVNLIEFATCSIGQ